MSKRNKRSRHILTVIILALLAGALVAAFWPRPMLVDMGVVARTPLQITIEEEGRTQVQESYVVSTPVAGRLLRVQVHPGDSVVGGETMVAQMRPTNPAALDVRTREQARAAVEAAQAALRLAQADLNAANADHDLARSVYERTRQLAESGTVSQAALDRAENAARAAQARLDTAEAAIGVREAELHNANARLIGFEDSGLANALESSFGDEIPIITPTSGQILRVFQESETVLPAGAPIMEIGDTENDLEAVVELISTDAVRIGLGDRVLIEDWGGADVLEGQVTRIDPVAISRYSALGVEEQRVPVTISFTSLPKARAGLGHGYRVEIRIVVWEAENVLTVPASALFRTRDAWRVFVVEDGIARLRDVTIGHSNGLDAEVLDGLSAGEQVILYPSRALSDGAKVAERTVE